MTHSAEVRSTETYRRARPPRHDIVKFIGKGAELFSILIVNGILTLITLGLYYPWAKVARLKYVYSHITIAGDALTFSATGKEYFYGFIKAFIVIGLWYGAYIWMVYSVETESLDVGLFPFFFLAWWLIGVSVYPLILHGAYRYRMSRTRWRGIRFAYTGNRGELFKKAMLWAFYTVITFGIYSAWYTINLRTYIINHIRLGNGRFSYHGTGSGFFGILFLEGILVYLTLGVYSFWFYRNIIRYYVDNLRFEVEGETFKMQYQGSAGDIFRLAFGNMLILLFTLGLGYPWTVVRTMKTIVNNISFYGDVDLDKIQQVHGDAGDGMSDDMMDFFEMDMLI